MPELPLFSILAIELTDIAVLVRVKPKVCGTTLVALSFNRSYGGKVLDVDKLEIAGPAPSGELYIYTTRHTERGPEKAEYIYRGRFLVHRSINWLNQGEEEPDDAQPS